jgi:PAS domain S-box-containing protein
MDFNENILKDSLPALFHSVAEGVIISDSNGTVLCANASAHNMFGYKKNEMTDLAIEDLIPKRFTDQHKIDRQAYSENPLQRAMCKNNNLFAKRKNGEEFPVEISLSHYICDSKLYIMSIVVDITERKEHEEIIHQLNLELEQKVIERTEALQKSLAELEESKKLLEERLNNEKELNDLKSRFVTTASHEFRTPLSTILLSMSLIERYQELNDTAQHQKHVKRVRASVTGLILILEDLLSTEELQNGLVEMNKAQFSLKDLTTNLIKKMHHILRSGQEISFSYKGQEEVILDKQIITTVLNNIISNASKFSDNDKAIQINIKTDDANVIIKVADKGVGIPVNEQKYIGDKFFRANNVTHIQGTGLGLNIVKQYVDLMHGKLKFESGPEKGTTFTITIPNNTHS